MKKNSVIPSLLFGNTVHFEKKKLITSRAAPVFCLLVWFLVPRTTYIGATKPGKVEQGLETWSVVVNLVEV